MTTPLTDVDVCSQALVKLGAAPIASFSEESETAVACAQLYPVHREHLLTCHEWAWTKTFAELAREVAAPLGRYRYSFVLPTDMLGGPLAAFPSEKTDMPLQRYEIRGTRLLADESRVWVHYQQNKDEADWPVWFRPFAVTATAAILAMPITDQANMAELLDRQAWGPPQDNRAGGLFGQAKRIDGNRQVGRTIFDGGNPLLAARLSGATALY